MDLSSDVDEVAAYLACFALRFGTESQLQADVETALDASDWYFVREHSLGKSGRIDFYLPDSKIGIECKVDGSPSPVARQLVRYAAEPSIAALVLVSSK